MEVRFDGKVRDYLRGHIVPPIYDIVKTVDMLVDTNKSFSRFGDGEFKLMTDSSVNHSFQRNSVKLRERLKEILFSDNDNVEIGINRIYYYKDGYEHPYIDNFIYKKGYAKMMVDWNYLDMLKRDHYYDSVFSIPVHHYTFSDEWFSDYFEKVKNIWRNKKVFLVTGDTAIMDYDFNIFNESARSVELIEISKTDAFEYYDRILSYIRNYDISRKDDIILTACGMTATVLAYDLGSDGYRTIDVGHLAREYNNFKRSIRPYSNVEGIFFTT